jgi:hypothetical protein
LRVAGEVGGEGVDEVGDVGENLEDADVGAEGGVCFDGLLDEGVGGAELGGTIDRPFGAFAEGDAELPSVDEVGGGVGDEVIVGVNFQSIYGDFGG